MVWGWLRRRRAVTIEATPAPAPAPTGDGADAPAPRPATVEAGVGHIDGLGGRRLGYDEAARLFVTWLQSRGETGEITKARLKALYAVHADEGRLAWLPENKLYEALAKVAARHERRVPRPDGRRVRTVTYDIPPAAPARIRSVA